MKKVLVLLFVCCCALLSAAQVQAVFRIMPGKSVFARFDKHPNIRVRFVNTSNLPMTDLHFFKDGVELESWQLDSLENMKPLVMEDSVDVSLKPGRYVNTYSLQCQLDGAPFQIACQSTYDLMPRDVPFMPVVMWQEDTDLQCLKDIGFTHDLVHLGSHGPNFTDDTPATPDKNTRYEIESNFINDRARMGLHTIAWITAGPWLCRKLADDPRYARLDRAGKPIPKANADVTMPDFGNFVEKVGESIALQFGNFPTMDAALIHSEVRDNSAISFRPENVAVAEKATGAKIPDVVNQKNGVDYKVVPGFPANHVVSKEDPILKFYSWWWKKGDGWNDLHSTMVRGLKTSGREDFWTFFDPAVRTPSVWGSGGDVDVISQWTYAHPDPLKIGEATDEIFAMAEGNPHQKVMTMTQVICYRYRIAPVEKLPKDESKRNEWEKRIPTAKFVTIPPDNLEIAFWSMISRPVQGIMYHGWNTLTGKAPEQKYGYEYTNEESQHRLKKLIHSVVKPLGASLLQIPDAPARVAMLESFASQIYDGAGTWGWSDSWEADMHLLLQWAGYQPQVVYDETIRKNGLDQFQVLAMPHCSVLTDDIVEAIEDFQRNGGIVVADDKVCPAILPDYVIPAYKRQKGADGNKKGLQECARKLRKALDCYITTPFRTSNMDLVGRMRQYHSTDYVFVINDKRTYGDYVGQYGLAMEKGLPNQGEITLERRGACVFDLVKHQRVSNDVDADGRIQIKLDMGPGEGKLFMVCDNSMDQLLLDAPQSVKRGQDFSVQIRVCDENGVDADAVVPLQVILHSTEGQAEGTGYYAAKDGRLTVTFNPAVNDLPGTWDLQVMNLGNGVTSHASIHVE